MEIDTLSAVAMALDVAIEHAGSSATLETEPSLAECAEVLMVALRSQGYRVTYIGSTEQ